MARRTRIASIVGALALVVGLAPPAVSQMEDPAPPSEPVDPATLQAPAAPDPVVMDCIAGRLDVNTPDPSAYASLPTPDGAPLSAPIGRRIAQGQPYLQPSDLLAVEGVTTDHLALWAREDRLCAEPPTLPPPAPDPCEGDQLDVNDAADKARFAKMFGGPTAERIATGIPYPSVINALRIAGVGDGNIKRYADRVCATPWPVQHDGVDYGFPTPELGLAIDTTGDFGSYELIVPAGATTGVGTWASITEADSQLPDAVGIEYFEIDTPTADPHIYGPWSGAVGVRLPQDGRDLGPGSEQAVIHHSSVHGLQLFANEGLALGTDGTLTVAVTDLSLVTAWRTTSSWLSGIGRAAVSAATWAERTWRNSMGLGGTASCDPDLGGQSLAGGELFSVTGQLLANRPLTPPLDHCITRAHSGSPDGRFAVNRGFVNVVSARDGVAFHDIDHGGTVLWSLIIGNAYNAWAVGNPGRLLFLSPGTKFSAHPTGYEGSFHIATNLLAHLVPTTGFWLLSEASNLLPGVLTPLLTTMFVDNIDCTIQFGRALDAAAEGEADALETLFNIVTNLVGCTRNVIQNIGLDDNVEVMKWFFPNPTVGQAVNAGNLMELIKNGAFWLKVAKYATVVADAAATAGVDGTVNLSWRPPEPATPPTDAKGRPVIARCVTKRFSYTSGWTVVINPTCQDLAYGDFPDTTPPPVGPPVNAWDDWVGEITSQRMYNVLRRDADGTLHLILLEGNELVAHPIASGDEWSFKEDWPEHEWRSAEFAGLIDRVGLPAVNDPLLLRNYTNGRGHSWLLREGNGDAWWVNSEGIRNPLPSVEAQQAVAVTTLTLHPAQWQNDICPYASPDDDPGAIKVC